MSATPDSTLANPEQRITDLEREITDLQQRLDEAQARETATAEVLQVINSSPGDLAPVFDAILEKALRLCGAAYGHVFRVEGDLGREVAARGDPELVEWLLKQGPVRPRSDGIIHRMMQGERVVQIPDSTDTEAYRAGGAIRQLIDRSGVRTTLGIALRNDSALLGTIFVNRREVLPFTDKQIALLQNFAAQAVIAMENARLITETREALEQQTATAEVLGIINSSPGDLAPVFEAILEKAHTLCGANQGSLMIYDGNDFRAVAMRGVPEPLATILRAGFQLVPGAPPEPLVRGEDVVHIIDMAAFAAESSPTVADLLRPAVESGARTILLVPLRKDNALLGFIAAYRQEVRPFTDKQIALLQNFAAQAVIAMENARLLTETREALDQQTATAEVLQVINSSPGELAPVFDAMLEKAMRLCDGCTGNLWTFDNGGARLTASRGLPAEIAALLRTRGEAGTHPLLLRIMQGEHLIQIPDIAEHELYRSEDSLGKAAQASVESGIRSLIWVALVKDGAALGAFVIGRTGAKPFSDQQTALLQNFAAQAVIAMENARLLTETREALEQQTATAEVLQVINSSPGDLAPVFEVMLDRAISLCEAAYGVLWTYSDEGFCAATLHGVPQPYAAHLAQEPIQLARGTNTALGQIADGSDFCSF